MFLLSLLFFLKNMGTAKNVTLMASVGRLFCLEQNSFETASQTFCPDPIPGRSRKVMVYSATLQPDAEEYSVLPEGYLYCTADGGRSRKVTVYSATLQPDTEEYPFLPEESD